MEKVNNTLKLRQPIVTILGHVDHGKTTLLDYIRKTNIASAEAGGITQSIGASVVTTKSGKKITFIDTPGHAAFANMRKRGVKIADVAILAVAADDGVKPQTKEALEYILSAGIPFLVAATKIDLASASINKVRVDLEKEQVLFEDRGGDVPLIAVSGKTGQGVEDLLEMVLLVSELHGIKGDDRGPLQAVVYEIGKDKRGAIVNVVVKNGTLRVGERIFAVEGGIEAKIKNIFNWQGKPVREAFPGEPAQILGFTQLPEVGSLVSSLLENVSIEVSRKKPFTKIDKKEGIPIFVKAKSAGSLEALLSNLPDEVFVVGSGVGDLTESDLFMAKSAQANIYLFESEVPLQVEKLAKTEGVRIERFEIIYELFEKIEEDIKKAKVEIKGKAKIVKIFPFDDKKIAGCKVIEGVITSSDNLFIMRNEEKIAEVRISSMKRGKDDITLVKQGEECGIIFTPQVEFEVGDVIISVHER